MIYLAEGRVKYLELVFEKMNELSELVSVDSIYICLQYQRRTSCVRLS